MGRLLRISSVDVFLLGRWSLTEQHLGELCDGRFQGSAIVQVAEQESQRVDYICM